MPDKRFTFVHLAVTALLFGIGAFTLVEFANHAYSGAWWWPVGGKGASTDTPLKVQGGAPTFRTKKNLPFHQVSNNNYCALIGSATSTLQLKLFQPGNHSPNPDCNISVPSGGQIDFYGRLLNQNPPPYTTESMNGIRVTILQSCNGANGLSASLTPEPPTSGTSPSSGFYPDRNNIPDDDDAAYIERFEDLTCSTTPPSSNGDEDTCEHLSSIYINNAATSSPKSGKRWRCINGECRVEFFVTTP